MSLLKRKGVNGIGTLIVCLCFFGPLVIAGTTPQKETSVLQRTNTIEHIPVDGLYWNDRWIAEYPVIFYLHYYFQREAHFSPEFIINGDWYEVEIYIQDLLQTTIEGSGPQYPLTWEMAVTPFHHSMKFGIAAYFDDGEVLWDNITIYRLFP